MRLCNSGPLDLAYYSYFDFDNLPRCQDIHLSASTLQRILDIWPGQDSLPRTLNGGKVQRGHFVYHFFSSSFHEPFVFIQACQTSQAMIETLVRTVIYVCNDLFLDCH